MGTNLFPESIRSLVACSQNHKRGNRLAFDVMSSSNDGCFSDGRVVNQR